MNLSPAYHVLLNQSEPMLSGEEIRELSDHYQVLLLKGFLGDLLPKRFDSYFLDQMRWLRQHGIHFRRLERESGYFTQKLSANNAQAIEHAIRTSYQERPGKKIIIVSHSKGGIDALETLLRQKQLIDTEVAGWIALQAPFRGTPVADWATRNRLFNAFAEKMLGGPFKGDSKVAVSMTIEARDNYMSRNSRAILDLSAKLNVLVFASSSEGGDASIFRPLRFAIEKIGKARNDGMLPVESQLLQIDGVPCCPYIEAEHFDHIALVLPLTRGRYQEPGPSPEACRIRIFRALLKIWMNNRGSPHRMPPRAMYST
ncbi:MAG: lipase/acyltransferase domain-containing protein [Methylococcales bacterium]